ncbi:MAG: acireductone dioxygenase [Acidimicrobiia bacterium]
MTRLIVMPDTDPMSTLIDTTDVATIAEHLGALGIDFEQWVTPVNLRHGADQDDVLAAYADDVARISASGGYITVDVVRLARFDETDAQWKDKAATSRERFLAEHTHADDEVRFFVEGGGAFYLRVDGRVHIVCCEAGDLLMVPAGTRHWFDMGTDPAFAAIRFFRIPEGWVGDFTGDGIASRFASYDTLLAR